MIARESSERKSLFIKVITIIITILLSFLATILYVTLYPKTTIVLYDMDGKPLLTRDVKKYSKLDMIPTPEKQGYTFLYWSYNDYGGEMLDPNVEVSSDVIRLYANYRVNQYKVSYNILYFDPNTGRYDYQTVASIPSGIIEYNTKFILPTGRDYNNNLIDVLDSKPGFHFAGWTINVVEEDDPKINDYLYAPGSTFVMDIAEDINFYAHWEKNQYTVNMHTGIRYELEGGNVNTPKKDADGKYIIKNLEPQELNENEGLIKGKIRYQDTVTSFVGNYSDIKLTEKNAGPAYGEYDFKGWYLDEDYTISTNGTNIQVLIEEKTEHPYIIYKDKHGANQRIYAKQNGVDSENKPIYEFDLYSKWERRSYEISFASTYGTLDSIQLYRVMTKEDGSLYDYENYYAYTYGDDLDTIYFGKVNLEKYVSQEFKDAGKDKYTGKEKNRLIGWEISDAPTTDEVVRYCAWRQTPWSEESASNRITGSVYYDKPIYTHTSEGPITLKAQWTKVYTIVFDPDNRYIGATFAVNGIKGEWFFLPDMYDVAEKGWKNSYHQLSGWKEGRLELSKGYLDKNSDGSPNPKYYFTVGDIANSSLSKTLYPIWEKMAYSATFYYNDGTDEYREIPLNGDDKKSFPEAPKREGYVFDGWSKYQYNDNEYSVAMKMGEILLEDKKVYTSKNSFSSNGQNPVYYASWTRNYTIEYDFNGGEPTTNTPSKNTYSYSDYINEVTRNGQYSMSKDQYLIINMNVGLDISISRGENYTFAGWSVRINDDELDDVVIKGTYLGQGVKIVFDFYTKDAGEMKYYNSVTEKNDLYLQQEYKVVLVARWTAAKYNVTIWRTNPSLVQSRVDSVSFDQDYTFSTHDANGDPYDNRVGYQFLGFALDPKSTVPDYAYNPDEMPVIKAKTLDKSVTFYTVYVEKNVTVEYKYKKAGAGDDDWTNYTPSSEFTGGQGNEVVGYNRELKVPTNPKLNGIDVNSKFKGWYYIDSKGERQDIVSGVKYFVAVSYNETDKMIIYADLTIDKYNITFQIVNPYTNKVIESIANILTVNKGTLIDDQLYQNFINLVNERIETYLNEYRVNQTSYDLRGYTLKGLFEVKAYDEPAEFALNAVIDPNVFKTLNNSTTLLIKTVWDADSIDVVYRISDAQNEPSQQSIKKYNEKILQLEPANIFTLDGGKVIENWYLLDAMTRDKQYFACGSVLFGSGSQYKSMHDLYQYISWDQDGNGTLNIYANIQQNSTINFYNYNQVAIEKVKEETFYLGNQTNELLNYTVTLGNLKFLGWYYYDTHANTLKKVTELKDSMFTADNGYTLDLYANYSVDINYYIVKIEGISQSKELSKTVSNTVLEYTPTNGYGYVREILIKSDDVPSAADVTPYIPQGYTYFGVKFGDKGYYKLTDILSGSAYLPLNFLASNATQGILTCETYYTVDYQVVYDANGSLINGEPDDKTEIYPVEHVGNHGKTVTIKYEATMPGKVFQGWQISPNLGAGAKVYKLNDEITLLETKTILVPYFVDPEIGTVSVEIVLVDGSNRYQSKVVNLKNGGKYTFQDNVSLNWIDNEQTISNWRDSNGRIYEVGAEFTIPVSVVVGTQYTFTCKWADIYTIQFTQLGNYQNATKFDSVSIKKGESYTIEQTPTISNLTFKGWLVQDLFDKSNKQVIIHPGDTIIVGQYLEYDYTQNINNSSLVHYIPAPSGNGYRGYVLVGEWQLVEYTISLVVTDPNDSSVTKTTITQQTPYGTTYTDRELLRDNVIVQSLEYSGQYAIVGWSATKGATSATADILKNITRDMTLYSVWQNKVKVTFVENSEIGYLDGQNNQVNSLTLTDQVPGDTLDINKLVKSIYVKGYTTVYFEDGTYKVYSPNVSNDYYQVVKFQVQGSTVTTLTINKDNSFDDIKIQSENMSIIPVVEKVHKVSFLDNSNSGGGHEYSIIPTNYVRSITSPNNEINITPNLYTNIVRNGYTFVGWNTAKDAEDKYESNMYTVESDTKFFAVWESKRLANFVATFVTNYSSTTVTIIKDIKINKDNKIDIDTLSECLSSPNSNEHCMGLEKLTNSVLANHPTYKYNSKNLYLDGFVVTDANGDARTLDINGLANFDFGSNDNNVNIRLNFKDIFAIEYSTGNKDGVVGDINAPDYIVALESQTGKLMNDGSIGTMELPVPSVTRENYNVYGWSTVNFDGAKEYNISNAEQRLLDTNELTAIINDLNNQGKNVYTLYADWEYKLIDIFVYTLADLREEGNGQDTTLVNPYDVYKDYTYETKQDIPFKNTANFIYQNSSFTYLVRNIEFNKGASSKIAQLRFNSSFKLITPDRVSVRSQFTTMVDGYELIGWSIGLYQLGYPVDKIPATDYFPINSEIKINNSVVIDGTLKLYPVYRVLTEEVNIQTINGSIEYTINSAVSGYVYNPNASASSTVSVVANSVKTIELNRYQTVNITRKDPINDIYIFDAFEFSYNADKIKDSTYITVQGSEFFDSHEHDHDHYIYVVFSAKQLALNIQLEYDCELKTGIEETTTFKFYANTAYPPVELATITKANSTKVVNAYLDDELTFVIENNSNYYDYTLKSGNSAIELNNGNKIKLTDLEVSANVNAQGYYEAVITIQATPKMVDIEFRFVKGTIADGTKLAITNGDVYVGYTEYELVKGNAGSVVSKVPYGSTITLPTSAEVNYTSGGGFVGFYVYGDEDDNTIVTSYKITEKVIFVELYNSNTYTVTYSYEDNNGGKTIQIAGIAHGSQYVIGQDKSGNPLTFEHKDGYEFTGWLDTVSGQEIVNDTLIDSLTQNYRLHAKYVAKAVTIKYVYDGNATGRVFEVAYGDTISTLKESDLADATVYTNKYISGWEYNGKFVTVGNQTDFKSLGFNYSDGAEIVFTAKYYSKYQYAINYVTTDVDNASVFTQDIHYVNTTDGSTIDTRTLKYSINAVEPISLTEGMHFTHYTVRYSTDGGSTYTDHVAGANELLLPGYQITLVEPTDVNITIIYEFTPHFENNVGVLDITYVITNPNYDANNLNDVEIFVEDTYKFNTNFALEDGYLPSIGGYAVDNNSKTLWSIISKGITFDIEHTSIDFRKFTLVGYTLEITNSNGDVSTRILTLGQSNNDRNVAGATAIKLISLWKENSLVKYFDLDGREITELREYIPYDVSVITLKSLTAFNAIENNTYNVSLADHTWIGWTTSSAPINKDNSGYYAFENGRVDKGDYDFYPALSQHYSIQVITTGVDSDDQSNFVLNTTNTLQPSYVYVGMNTAEIDLSNYTYPNVYSECESSKYLFLGYSTQEAGQAGYICTFDLDNLTNDGKLNIYAIWQKNTYKVNVEFVALDNSGVNKAEEYSLKDENALVKIHGVALDLYSFDGTDYTFNSQIGDIVSDILSQYDYFKFQDIVIIYSANNVSEKLYSYTANESTTITVRFAPVYKITYYLYEQAELEGYDPNNMQSVDAGEYITPRYDYTDIVYDGYTILYWGYRNYSILDGQQVFTEHRFFKDNNNTVVNSFDPSEYTFSEDYILTLYPVFNWDYTVNLYYIDSVDKVIEFNQLLATNPNPTEEQKQDFYTPLTSLDMYIGDGLLVEDSNHNIVNVFDEKIAEANVSINGNTITKFEDLFTVFESQQYISNGFVTVNNGNTEYDATYSSDNEKAPYYVKTYNTVDYDTNNIYIVYSPIEHNVLLGTIVVDENGEYSQELASQHFVKTEYGVTADQINDNGDDNIENPRFIGSSINLYDIATSGQEYYMVGLDSITYLDSIYLFNEYVRVENKGYEFQKWMIAEYSLNGNSLDVTFKELDETVNVSDSNEIITISGITKNITLVALYKVDTVTVNITVQTTNGLGHQLDVTIKGAKNNTDTYTPITHTMTPDVTNKVATTSIEVQMGSWLEISGITSNQFVVDRINNGLRTYTSASLNVEVNNSLMSGGDDTINFVITYRPITYNVYVSTVYSNSDDLKGSIDFARYYFGSEQLTTNQINSILETYNNCNFNYKTEVIAFTHVKQDFATPTLTNYTFTGWEYYNSSTSAFELVPDTGIEVAGNIYLRAVFEPKDVIVRYYMDVTEDPNDATRVYKRILGLDDQFTKTKVGQTITLPYVVIELNDRISSGWMSADTNTNYKFGDAIKISTLDNVEFVADESGNLFFDLYATIVERHYVYYSQGDSSFKVGDSDYPIEPNESSVVYEDSFAFESAYYYARLSSMPQDTIELTDTNLQESETFAISTELIIPTYSIESEDGSVFIGWQTDSSNQTYKNGNTYQYTWVDDTDNNHIILKAIKSDYIELQFYITNPYATDGSTLQLTQRTSDGFTMPYMSILVNKESPKVLYMGEFTQDKQYATWTFDRRINYFTTNTLEENVTIQNNYRLYGWSINNSYNSSFDDINVVKGYNNVVSILNSSYDLDIVECINNLKSLLVGVTSSPIRLYTVWETKHEVKFTFNNNVVSTGMYAKGDTITAPNHTTNSEIAYSDENGKPYKWLGWVLNTANDDMYVKGIDEYTQPSTYEFVNGVCSWTYIDSANQEYITLWEKGYKVILNMNFDAARETVGSVMGSYTTQGGSITNSIGYPRYVGTNELVSAISSSYQLTIGETDFYSQFAYGNLWTEQSIDLSNLTSFVDNGIYPVNIPLTLASWLNSYYTFDGWSLDDEPDSTRLTSEELSNMQFNDNDIVLYAQWSAIELTINMFASETLAKEAEINGMMSNVTKHVTFGSLEYLDYIEKLATGTLPDGDPNKQNSNQFIKNHQRFNRWVPVRLGDSYYKTGDTINDEVDNKFNEGISIVNNLFIYPIYVEEFTVKFYSVYKDQNADIQIGNELKDVNNPDVRQKVIEGEQINIIRYVENNLRQNKAYIGDIYYYDSSSDPIQLWSRPQTEIQYVELLSFNKSGFKIDNEHYVNIYIRIDAKVILNITPVNGVEQVYNTVNIPVQESQLVFDGYSFNGVYNLDTAIYGESNKPILEGWYFYQNNMEETFVENNKVNSFKIITDVVDNVAGYYIVITNDSAEPIKIPLNSLNINLYAKLVIEVTVQLGEDDDQTIVEYAKISSLEIPSTYPTHVQNLLNSTLISTLSESRDGIKSFKYKTLFGDDYHPKFIIETNAYNITSITGLFTAEELVDQLKLTNAEITNADTTNASAKLIKTITPASLQTTYTLQFNSVNKNNQVFKIAISIHTITVKYSFNEAEGTLLYRENESTATFSEFRSNSHDTEVDRMYASGSYMDVTTLDYNVDTNVIDGKNIKIITYTNVPYGAKIYINAMPVDSMLTHFVGWNAGWSSVDDTAPTADVPSIQKNAVTAYIKFYPIELIDENNLLSEYVIEANFDANAIAGFNLLLDFEAGHLLNEDNTLNPWGQLLNEYSYDKQKITNPDTGKLQKYTIPIVFNGINTNNLYVAGSNITDLLKEINRIYTNTYDVLTITTPESSLNLTKLLRYFWFDVEGLNWSTNSNIDDLNKKPSDGILTDAGIIYALDGSTVTLRKNMTPAIVLDVNDRTIDYTTLDDPNGYTIINGVDRAETTFAENGYDATSSLVPVVTNNGSRLLKTKYNPESIVNVKVTPNDATVKHSQYVVRRWVFESSDVNNVGGNQGDGVITPNGDKTEVQVKFTSQVYDYFLYINSLSMPELRLRADVVAQTYKVNFKNSDGSHIKSIDIAYDSDIFAIDNSIYSYYSYTLNTLFKAESKHTMPRFELMEKKDGIDYFAHREDKIDRGAYSYGDYKYIFKGWASSTDNTTTLSVEEAYVLRAFDSNNNYYSDVNLYAYYQESNQVYVTIFMGEECVETKQTMYLMPKDYKDDFETEYTNDNFNQQGVKSFIKPIDPTNTTNADYEFYAKDSMGKYIKVATLSDLTALGSNIIYPAIVVNVNTGNNSSTTVTSIGGKVILMMATDGKLVVGNIVAELNGNNVVADNMDINFAIDNSSNFAYWSTTKGHIKDFVTSYSFSNANVDAMPVYNPNFAVNGTGNGEIKITDSTGTLEFNLGSILKVYDKSPTCVDFNEDCEIKLVYESITPGERTIALLQMIDVKTGKVLYKFQFSTNVVDAKIRWNIQQGNIASSIVEVGNSYLITNDDGFVTITPLVVPGEVTVKIEDFVITNLEDQYTQAYTYSKSSESIKIAGGSIFSIVNEFDEDNQYVVSSAINLKDINNVETIDALVATYNNDYMSLFSNGVLRNFRWEYKTDNGWANLDGKYADTRTMTIRFAADWQSINLTFAKANAIPNNVATDIDGYNLAANGSNLSPLKYNNYKIVINDQEVDSMTLSMLKGESLTYNKDTHLFELVTNIDGRSDQQIAVKYDGNEACLQGWLQYITALNLISDESYSSMTDVTYYAWVEGKVELSLDMNTTATGVVAGYGDVIYTVTNPYATTETTATIDLVNRNYGSITCGISSHISITWDTQSRLGHVFENITYTTLDSNSEPITYSYYENAQKTPFNKYAYQFYDTTLSILFDATPSEKSLYLAYSDRTLPRNITNVYKIYGGYELGFEKIDNTIVLAAKDYFNADVSGLNGLTIHMTNTNNTNSSSNLYPRSGYSLNSLSMYSDNNLTVGSKIEFSADYSITGIYNSESVQLDTYAIDPSQDINKNLVLYLGEYVSTLTLKYQVNINKLPDDYGYVQVDTLDNLSLDTVYLSDGTTDVTGASNDYSLEGLYNNIQLECAKAFNNKDSIKLDVTNNASQFVITNAKYKLKSVSLLGNRSEENTLDNTCELGLSKVVNSPINYNEYVLRIVVNETKESKIAFKFTLLHQDMTNIDLRIEEGAYSNAVNLQTFNSDSDEDGNIDVLDILVEKDDTVKIESANGRTYLKFYRYQRDVANFVYLSISYNNQITDYNIKGWYMDKSSTHLGLNYIAKTITPDSSYGSATASNLEYVAYSYDNTNAITTTEMLIEEDCAFVLDIERKPVYIYVDDTTNKYWPTNISNISKYSTENDFIKAAINDTNSNGSLYIAPSGLVNLSFPDDNTTNFIKKGNAILDLFTAQDPIELVPSVDSSYKEVSFAVINTSNVECNNYLLGSEKWKLVNIPYGDADQEIQNYIEVHFHAYEKEVTEKDLNKTVLNVLADDFNFLTNDNDSSSVTYFVAKNKYNRLYEGLFTNNQNSSRTYYGAQSLTFYNLASSSVEYDRLLAGYSVYDEYYNQLATCVSGIVDISGYSENILHIYPVWKEVNVYEIVIDDWFDLNRTYYCREGETFGLGFGNTSTATGGKWYTLNVDPFTTESVYVPTWTENIGGLPCINTYMTFDGLDSVQGHFMYVNYEGTELIQPCYTPEEYCSVDAYFGMTRCACWTDTGNKNYDHGYHVDLFIWEVNNDINIRPMYYQIGREVTYKLWNLSGPYDMKEPYTKANVSDNVHSFPYMLHPMLHPVGTYLPIEWGEDACNYFEILGYYETQADAKFHQNAMLPNYNSVTKELASIAESDTILSRDHEIYYNIYHNKHKIYTVTSTFGSYLGATLGSDYDPCYIYTNTYSYDYCEYCNYSYCNYDYYVITGEVQHDDFKPSSEWDWDDTYHWHNTYCERCGASGSVVDHATHDFDRAYYVDETNHMLTCPCGCELKDEHSGTFCDWYNDTSLPGNHTRKKLCPECENEYSWETNGHENYFSDWTVTVAATCTTSGTKTRECSVCHLTETQTISATGHDFSTEIRKEASCQDGYSVMQCSNKNCEERDWNTYITLAANGVHNVGEGSWTVTTKATCTTTGTQKGYCPDCKKYVYETIDKLGHDFENIGKNGCSCSSVDCFTQDCSRCSYWYKVNHNKKNSGGGRTEDFATDNV